MFQNKGKFLQFKSNVENVKPPDGWSKVNVDCIQIKNNPKLFIASLTVPVRFSSEAFESFESIVTQLSKPGDLLEYNRMYIHDGITPEGFLVVAQHIFQASADSTTILLFAEEADHHTLEETIRSVIEDFKEFDISVLPQSQEPHDWDLALLKQPRDKFLL